MGAGRQVIITLPRQLRRIAKIGVTDTSRPDVVLVETRRRVVEVTNGFALLTVPIPDTDGLEELEPFLIPREVIEQVLAKKPLRAAEQIVVQATVGLDIPVYRLVRVEQGHERGAVEFEALPYGSEHGFYAFDAGRLIPDRRPGAVMLGLDVLEPLLEVMKATESPAVRIQPGDRWSDPLRIEIGDVFKMARREPSAVGAAMQMWTPDRDVPETESNRPMANRKASR